MSNKDTPNILADSEIDDVINAAVVKFKNNESIVDYLLEINGDEDKFNEWAWDKELGEKDYVLIESVGYFLIAEDISEIFEADGMDLNSDADILNFIASHIENAEFWESAIYYEIDEICIGVRCEIHGQGGAHFLDFGIYSSEEQYFESLTEAGYICLDGNTVVSHTASDLISMFKKNVTAKYLNS
tara:strand:+ start:262 stop:819 length:558 start_codon:yes stop_codon:yes gene_type:complete